MTCSSAGVCFNASGQMLKKGNANFRSLPDLTCNS